MSEQKADPIVAARAVARRVVREHFPELIGVEPQVIERAAAPLHPADAQRLGTTNALNVVAATEYTFIFARELHTADGFTIPRIARVTIDTQQRVVKAVMSK